MDKTLKRKEMDTPVSDPNFWSWFLYYLWSPFIAAAGGYMLWVERRLDKKADKEVMENSLKQIKESTTNQISQNEKTFVELFHKLEVNKDRIDEKTTQILEKINSNYITLLSILAAKQNRRSTDNPL